ncbi:MAG: hypothetical protein BroJett024_22510 [Alphaproteobacteria bacterium]|nr:MAG: hypothetical protein BroJett024_22510 [Alphaproteobacteria bacterium]
MKQRNAEQRQSEQNKIDRNSKQQYRLSHRPVSPLRTRRTAAVLSRGLVTPGNLLAWALAAGQAESGDRGPDIRTRRVAGAARKDGREAGKP